MVDVSEAWDCQEASPSHTFKRSRLMCIGLWLGHF